MHWDPEFCDVKLIQTMMLLDQLKRIVQDSSMTFRPGQKFDPSSIQLLLCGDLNSLPESGFNIFHPLLKYLAPIDVLTSGLVWIFNGQKR